MTMTMAGRAEFGFREHSGPESSIHENSGPEFSIPENSSPDNSLFLRSTDVHYLFYPSVLPVVGVPQGATGPGL